MVLIVVLICNVGALFYVAPLRENMSYLGNALGHPLYLFVWGGSAALYFYWYTLQLMHHFSYSYRFGKALLRIACLMMIVSLILPYRPSFLPDFAKWHVRIAMWGTILYIFLFFHVLFDIMKKDYPFYKRYISYYYSLILLDTFLFVFYGSVSTLLEISFTIGMSIILYSMDTTSNTP